MSAGHGRRAQHLDAVALGEARLHETTARRAPENLSILLREPFRTMSEELVRRLAERGHPEVRFAHGSVFQFLDDDGTRVSVLAERAQHGYVERVPDPADGRAKLVRATSRGRAVFAIARELMAEVDARLEARLGTDKLRQLRALLKELGDVL